MSGTSSSPATRFHGFLAKLVGRPTFWLVVLAALFAWPILRSVGTAMPAPLAVLGTVPDFQLTDQHGGPFGSTDLRGRAWVANFIFTRCPSFCPRFTTEMAGVQRRLKALGSAVHLVSFSVDPDYDTPEILADYAHRFGANPRAWSFLTGPLTEVRATVVGGLKVAMGRTGPTEAAVSGIFHGNRFVLVDPEMQIRGYYDAASEAAVEALIRDVGLLLNRGH